MTLISNVNWTMKGLKMISLFPIGKPSTGFPKPSVILIHSRKKLRRIKGKRRKKETSNEEPCEDEIPINMGIESVPQEQEKQHLASNTLVLLPNHRQGAHMQWIQSSVY